MLGRRLVLLAGLLAGAQVRAAVVRIESLPHDRTGQITVSWDLPDGFDESELLVEVEGGPRVRLTGEIRGRNPRVNLSLPPLAGRARFVVRAGRDDEERERRGLAEQDIAFSESFPLGELPTSPRAPVRAAASRPASGHEMEWWSELPAHTMEGPVVGFSAPCVTDGAIRQVHVPALRSPRPDSPAVTSSRLEARSGGSSPPSGSSLRLLLRPFSGARAPLRN